MRTSIRTRRLTVLAVILFPLLILGGCSRNDSGNPPGAGLKKSFKIGFVGSPLAAPLYVSETQWGNNPENPPLNLLQFKTTADVGYALLSGDIDAGFIEPIKAQNLLRDDQKTGLKVAGSIEFPYGATLVLRKDLQIRLSDLEGRTVAAEDDHCALVAQFKKDARRLGVDPGKIRLVFMPFEDMIPALEAKTVDAVITKGFYGVIGESLGHKILYQNWNVAAGADECCPAILAQTVYFLVVRPVDDIVIGNLVKSLVSAADVKPSEARGLMSKKTGISQDRLGQFPIASFSQVSNELRKILKNQTWGVKQ